MSLQNLRPAYGSKQHPKRIGRGQGSGKGTYAGKGGKGQTARSGGGRSPGFEGGQTPISRRLPKYRGFTNPNMIKYEVVNVKDLNIFNDGDTVTKKELAEKKLVKRNQPVKILGDGELTKKLTVEVEKVSKSAEEKITKAKGTVRSTGK